MLSATGCTANEAFFFDMPEGVTNLTDRIRHLWEGAWIAAWAVGVLTWALIIYAIIVYRRRRGAPTPVQTRYNLPIEIMYTVAPLIMILGLFFFSTRDQLAIQELSPEPDNTVNVVAFRWSWGFNYLDEQVYDVGTPGQRPTLWLPVDESVRFELTSPDVNHSFWVPQFLYKMDVIPGRVNRFEVTPTKEGTYAGKCAELCGVDHSRMLFDVRVVSRAQYAAHMAELRAKGQTGVFGSDRELENADNVEKTQNQNGGRG
ncbi:MAG: cytochrome c oxidase subunit II [Actinomycetota bacterium]|nr:MAG: cytochrome c oxidase subunit II [Actinomycetota bacterium]